MVIYINHKGEISSFPSSFLPQENEKGRLRDIAWTALGMGLMNRVTIYPHMKTLIREVEGVPPLRLLRSPQSWIINLLHLQKIIQINNEIMFFTLQYECRKQQNFKPEMILVVNPYVQVELRKIIRRWQSTWKDLANKNTCWKLNWYIHHTSLFFIF